MKRRIQKKEKSRHLFRASIVLLLPVFLFLSAGAARAGENAGDLTGKKTAKISASEVDMAETVIAEAAKPETVMPETTMPETAMPETYMPETAMPETAMQEEDMTDSQDLTQNVLLLQMIAQGDLDDFDPEDMLYLRICSALLTQLEAITDEDIESCASLLSEEEETIRELYYQALASCLFADILYRQETGTPLDDARRVLELFLEERYGGQDQDDENDERQQQRQEIRDRITDETIGLIARQTDTGAAFVRWLIVDAVP